MPLPSLLHLTLPHWLRDYLASQPSHWPSDEQRMQLVLELARRNIEAGDGPFAAAVFDAHGRLLGAGVNQVTRQQQSLAHAEVLALAMAEQHLGDYQLTRVGAQLVSSAEPCSMCQGALHWAGISSLLYAASDADVRAIGFDEGDKPAHWANQLRERGIQVRGGLAAQQARQLLHSYRQQGGPLYNGSHKDNAPRD